MTSNSRDRVLVVVTLAGGNDALNSLIPYSNPLYYDYRPTLGVPEEQVLPISGEVGFHPNMVEMKEMYDEGNVAVIQGVGYPNPSRSHFRSMDIWHTCEPDRVGDEGWLGRAVRDIDPNAENVLTGVSFGNGLPRAFAAQGVPVASVGNLEKYGLLTGIEGDQERSRALDIFARMYAPAIGSGAVLDYIDSTGRAALKGADILKTAPAKYSSTVEYGADAIAEGLKSTAQVHLADLGTRVMYVAAPFNAYDTHSGQAAIHSKLLRQVSTAIGDFYQDLKEHNTGDEVVMLVYSEFGRRARDNGGGTDHGTGGVCWVIGEQVKGGLYSEYPSLKQADLEDGGDLLHTVDFRSVYTTLLEDWLELDSRPIVGGAFEPVPFIQ